MRVIIYKTSTGRWAWVSEKGNVSKGNWATKAYAVKVAKSHGFAVSFK